MIIVIYNNIGKSKQSFKILFVYVTRPTYFDFDGFVFNII